MAHPILSPVALSPSNRAPEPAEPEAVVLTCGCLPEPEALLGRPPGTLIVHQAGGLWLDASALATVGYGRAFLGLTEILVIGHAGCRLADSRCDEPGRVAAELAAMIGAGPGEVVALVSDGRGVALDGAIAIDG
ncbi:MAG: hypothetical protein H6737_04625 [Alphaproteobacteria bacterium]|nr:hypothetical protein [Alphaproteobacteria bacterium]